MAQIFFWIQFNVAFKIISLISRWAIGRCGKTGVPWENHLTHPQAELGLSHMWPVRGSNLHQSQRWCDQMIKSTNIQRPYPLCHRGRPMAQISCTVAAQLISTLVFTSKTVKFLFFQNRKFQASSMQLCLCRTWSLTSRQVFLWRSSYSKSKKSIQRFTGVIIIFLFLPWNIDCGPHLGGCNLNLDNLCFKHTCR